MSGTSTFYIIYVLLGSLSIFVYFLNNNPTPAGGVGGEHVLPFVPVAALHHQQMAAAVTAAHHQQQFQRQLGHFGSPPGGQFDHGFLARQPAMHRMMGAAMPVSAPTGPAYIEDLESGGGGRKVLTLFPTAED